MSEQLQQSWCWQRCRAAGGGPVLTAPSVAAALQQGSLQTPPWCPQAVGFSWLQSILAVQLELLQSGTMGQRVAGLKEELVTCSCLLEGAPRQGLLHKAPILPILD